MARVPRLISRRRILAAGGIVVVVILAAGAWLVLRGLSAHSDLNAAKVAVTRLRADLLADRQGAIQTDLHQAEADSAGAYAATHDIVWDAVSFLPPVSVVRSLTGEVDQLARAALPPLAAVGPSITPRQLRTGPHTIALAPLEAAAAPLARAEAATKKVAGEVARLPGGWFPQIAHARDAFAKQLASLSGSLQAAVRFARIGPAMLGANGPRTYFIGIQTNAESRGTGGLIGAFAVLRADHGSLSIVARGSDTDLVNAPAPVVNLGADFNQAYTEYQSANFWLNTNISMNFPYAGRIWTALYARMAHQHIDGAVGIDPVALSDILAATGPVRMPGSGQLLTAANFVAFTEQTEYQLFPALSQDPARKAFLQAVSKAVTDKLFSGVGDARLLITELGRAAATGHLQLYSTHPAEEAVIAGTPLGGQIPEDGRPFAAFSVTNGGGDKLDYYLNRSLTYTAGACTGIRRASTITVRLTNEAPLSGLPPYVRSRPDLGIVEKVPRSPLIIFVYASQNAFLKGATLNGHQALVQPLMERGHPMFEIEVTLDPGVPAVLTLHMDEPSWPGRPQTFVQPLVRPQRTTFAVPVCRAPINPSKLYPAPH